MLFHELDEATYKNIRYAAILKMEESGEPSLLPYVDSVGLTTIGAGFNITDDFVRDAVFAELDIGSSGRSYRLLSNEAKAVEDYDDSAEYNVTIGDGINRLLKYPLF